MSMSEFPRVHFQWMGSYWSCTSGEWDKLQECIDQNKPIELSGCRELKSKPLGVIRRLRDVCRRVKE